MMKQLHKKTNIKISVISTVYNGTPYFERFISSILGQNYEQFELVIVDDGSTDSTPNLLQKLAQESNRVKVFLPGRLGRAKALNYAVEKAQGIYIANQDFDDISYPERLRLQADFLDAHPQVGLVGGSYVRIDEERQEKYIRTPPQSHPQLIKKMAQCVPFAHTITTFRKEAWEQAGGYPLTENLIDLRFWLELVKCGWQVASIPDIVGEHFVHPASFWHRNFQYRQRQRDLAQVQWQVVKKLHLPFWYGAYPLSRYAYSYLPNDLKRFVRRNLLGMKEKDIVQGAN
ncbi:MAG: glycosyltransferase [Moorea sp. SIO2I5]|nr:glycosyltransferase [Moorena sp. SIO2I5]